MNKRVWFGWSLCLLYCICIPFTHILYMYMYVVLVQQLLLLSNLLLTGFVLEGFDIEHSKESLGDVISATTKLLPEDKPRFIHGLETPGNNDLAFLFYKNLCGLRIFESIYAAFLVLH